MSFLYKLAVLFKQCTRFNCLQVITGLNNVPCLMYVSVQRVKKQHLNTQAHTLLWFASAVVLLQWKQ